jgi:lipopolysaccharide transport system ATP-binding protein
MRLASLGKCYHIYDRPSHRLLQSFVRRRLHQEFWALTDVSLEISSGEVVGVLGRNGSGKSTLMQILAGTLEPTVGSVEIQGRVAALLELGAGFNPEFTGLENVYMNASVLGLSREETDRRLDEILGFADIGAFVRQPVKHYSSGMYVRLAFAVAASIDPDILLVDEALAVGDVRFQNKCFRHFRKLIDAGKTILLVTHSSEQVVRHCSRAIILDGGRLLADGEPRKVVNRYLSLMLGTGQHEITEYDSRAVTAVEREGPNLTALGLDGRFEDRPGYCDTEHRWGQGGARILDFSIHGAGETMRRMNFFQGERMEIHFLVAFERACRQPVFGLFVKTPDGVTVYGNSSVNMSEAAIERGVAAGESVAVSFRCELNVGPGSYLLSLGVASEEGIENAALDRRYDAIRIEVVGTSGSVGVADMKLDCTARKVLG